MPLGKPTSAKDVLSKKLIYLKSVKNGTFHCSEIRVSFENLIEILKKNMIFGKNVIFDQIFFTTFVKSGYLCLSRSIYEADTTRNDPQKTLILISMFDYQWGFRAKQKDWKFRKLQMGIYQSEISLKWSTLDPKWSEMLTFVVSAKVVQSHFSTNLCIILISRR